MFFLRFGKWNSTNLETEQKSTLKKVLMFYQKTFFWYFGKLNFQVAGSKNFRRKLSELKKTSRYEKISYILGNGTFLPEAWKALIFFLKGLKSCKIISWRLIFFYYIVNVFPNVHRFNKKFFFFDHKIHTFSFLKIYAICYLYWKEYA